MRNLEELLKESSAIHGHHCAGQVLGVRMAMVGCREVGIDEPKGCKKLIVYVEMDRCATDAVQAVTGCSLGKRTLKFLDYGKMAVTFVNTETKKAVRVLARDDARKLAPLYAENAANPRDAQMQAYRVMPEEALFVVQPISVEIPALEMPGYRGERVQCEECGEGINFHREVRVHGRILCVACAQGGLLPKANGAEKTKPKVVLIVGYKKTGKTTLIEKLIPELSHRGYRVGTVKHHHSDFPATFDGAGTDTWRHRRAGAASVALATPAEIATFRDNPDRISLDEIVAGLGETDVVLVEGFHDEGRAKIEVLADRNDQRVCRTDGNLLAVVSTGAPRTTVPTFAPGEIKPLADLIEREILAGQ
ncbi:MAG TPA: molybdopterin-guanine dinucleotide biosynthesis protein B [Methylomirabilota bacterium]|nr:molybdopterin-guanine dinucleotide biosynthesis protein B [Methylomirabilota bacterium]